MQFYKNKKSKKYFIYIEDSGNNEALLVTPESKIKSVSLDLFVDGPEGGDEERFLIRELITKEQVARFRQYRKYRIDEMREKIEKILAKLPPHERQKFFEDLEKI